MEERKINENEEEKNEKEMQKKEIVRKRKKPRVRWQERRRMRLSSV